MENSVCRVEDDDLHAELCEIDLILDVCDGAPCVELILAPPISNDELDVAVYSTPLGEILDMFIAEHEPENLRIVSEFLQGYIDRIVTKLSEQ